MPKFEVITIERQIVERRMKYTVDANNEEEVKDIMHIQDYGLDTSLINDVEVLEEYDVEEGLININILECKEVREPIQLEMNLEVIH